MTILEAITMLQTVKPHQYDDNIVVNWISTLEGLIYNEVISWHTGTGEEVPHGPYNAETDMDTVLMVPEPYSDVYIKYLAAQIDYYNGEYTRYNNSMIMYNMALSAFADWYNRTHKPAGNTYIRI